MIYSFKKDFMIPYTAALLALLATGASPIVCFGQRKTKWTEIRSNSFVAAGEMDLKSFISKYKPTLLSRQKTTNLHKPAQHDYILTYQVGPDKFVFYQTPEKTLTLSFTCSTPLVGLAKGVRVGMSQTAFERVFNRKVASTSALVMDTEGFEVYTFTFLKHTLAHVDYQCRID